MPGCISCFALFHLAVALLKLILFTEGSAVADMAFCGQGFTEVFVILAGSV